MSAYGPLAGWYDALTRDVDYRLFADLYERTFRADAGEFHTLLDLGCGTGSLVCLMAKRGYELIGTDGSVEMLMEAQRKAAGLKGCIPPLLICQSAAELDLYGTVDAAYSSLESINYISPPELTRTFARLRLFVRPGGLLIFDVRSPEFLMGMDGSINVDENDDILCLWRGRFDTERRALIYGMDIFERRGEHWLRSGEEHIEYAHEPDWLKRELERAGFGEVRFLTDGPDGDAGRIFIQAKRK